MTDPTISETRSLRDQMEERIFELVRDFEDITGMTVTNIHVSHERKAGFGEKETIDINIITEL